MTTQDNVSSIDRQQHPKKKVTLGCNGKLIALAKQLGINLSVLLENAIVYELDFIQSREKVIEGDQW